MQKDLSKSSVSWRATSSPRLRLNLVFVSSLRRYPSDTDNQIYWNSETRIWNPILLVLISCTASFQICLWISPCAHLCFAHYHSIAPRKISSLRCLSLVSSWKPYLFINLSVICKIWILKDLTKTVSNHCVLNIVIAGQIIFSPVFSNRG